MSSGFNSPALQKANKVHLKGSKNPVYLERAKGLYQKILDKEPDGYMPNYLFGTLMIQMEWFGSAVKYLSKAKCLSASLDGS